jgi:hypothetical protein
MMKAKPWQVQAPFLTPTVSRPGRVIRSPPAGGPSLLQPNAGAALGIPSLATLLIAH